MSLGILLFGKVLVGRTFQNCCVVIQGMKRNAFLLLKRQGQEEAEHKTHAEEAFYEFKNKCLNKAFFIRPDKYISTITKAQNFESIYYLIDEFKIKLD